MIIEHTVIGGDDSVYHDFSYTQSGMTLTVSAGSYYEGGKASVTADAPTDIAFPVSTNDTQYTVYLTTNGFYVTQWVLGSAFQQDIPNVVDRLAWLIIPAGTTTLDNINIDVLKVVKE
jgi:hypothetical protein